MAVPPVPVVPPDTVVAVPVAAVPPVPVVPPEPVVAVPPVPLVPPEPVVAVPSEPVVPPEPVVPVPDAAVPSVAVVPPEPVIAVPGALVIVFIIAGSKLNVCVRSLMFIAIGCSITTPVIIGSAVGLIVVVVVCLFIKLYMPNKASI